MIERERAPPEGLRDVCYAIVAYDVESEASCSGDDAWIVTDAAAILVAGDIANIMVAVFDAPMAANDVGPCAGRKTFGG